MRRLIAFPCGGDTLAGTLDEAPGATGLLIVSGGNEVRAGAHRGMATLAARLAADGIPVFRYDRRGVGDSTGDNHGFAHAHNDLIAAAVAFRAEAPRLRYLVGFGNCDGAGTLALFGRDAGIGRLVLANPWLAAEPDDLPAAAAIRARYLRRLTDPAAWRRLLGGGIDFGAAARGIAKLARRGPADRSIIDAIAGWSGAAHVVLARDDATAIAYAASARRTGVSLPTTIIDTASHSFARPGDGDALTAAILAALR